MKLTPLTTVTEKIGAYGRRNDKKQYYPSKTPPVASKGEIR
jgi:hypothetical protein